MPWGGSSRVQSLHETLGSISITKKIACVWQRNANNESQMDFMEGQRQGGFNLTFAPHGA